MRIVVDLDLTPMWRNNDSPAVRHMRRTGAVVLAVATAKAPTDTGRLRTSGYTRRMLTPYPIVCQRVGFTAPHALFVHKGTGIYGPAKKRIRPKSERRVKGVKRARRQKGARRAVLSWVGKDGKRRYARWVRGSRPRRYLTTAVKEVIGKTPRRRNGGGDRGQ